MLLKTKLQKSVLVPFKQNKQLVLVLFNQTWNKQVLLVIFFFFFFFGGDVCLTWCLTKTDTNSYWQSLKQNSTNGYWWCIKKKKKLKMNRYEWFQSKIKKCMGVYFSCTLTAGVGVFMHVSAHVMVTPSPTKPTSAVDCPGEWKGLHVGHLRLQVHGPSCLTFR